MNIKKMKLVKNVEALERKFDKKYTFKNIREVEGRAKAQVELIDEKIEELEKEMKELSYLRAEYENIEIGAKQQLDELENMLNMIGGDLEGGVRETIKSIKDYEELECYIGVVEKMYYAGALIGERPEIALRRYRVPEGVKRGDINSYEEVSILELNEFVNEFYN